MPSSVGHALAGYAASQLFGGRLQDDWIVIGAATAPDLDIVLGILRRRPPDYSRRRSHSIGAALAAGVALGGWSSLSGRRFVPAALKGATAYGSHLILDYFGKEAEDGLPLLWPFSEKRISARRPLFRTIYSRRGRFFSGLLTARNLRKVGREVIILTPAILLALGIRQTLQALALVGDVR